MALYNKPDFTFNDHNRATIRLNRECVVELVATPDRNDINQYGVAVTVHNELNGDKYGDTMNIPKLDGKTVVWNASKTAIPEAYVNYWNVDSPNKVSAKEDIEVTTYVHAEGVEYKNGDKLYVYQKNGTSKKYTYYYNTTSYTGFVVQAGSDDARIVTATNDNDDTFAATESGVNSGEYVKIRYYNLTTLFGKGNEPVSTDDPRIYWIDSYAAIHPEYNAGELVQMEV